MGDYDDLFFADLRSPEGDINLMKEHKIYDVKSIIFDDGMFYILANKRNFEVGYFLLGFNQDTKEVEYYMNWEHKLPIDDADMSVLNQDLGDKHIVVSYATQFIDTYNIFVINLKSKKIRFWHESYALYEAELTGFLLADDNFLIFDRFGMFLVSLK